MAPYRHKGCPYNRYKGCPYDRYKGCPYDRDHKYPRLCGSNRNPYETPCTLNPDNSGKLDPDRGPCYKRLSHEPQTPLPGYSEEDVNKYQIKLETTPIHLKKDDDFEIQTRPHNTTLLKDTDENKDAEKEPFNNFNIENNALNDNNITIQSQTLTPKQHLDLNNNAKNNNNINI